MDSFNFALLAYDPVLVQLGPFSIRWYGAIIATGIVLGYLVAQKEAVRQGLHEETLTDLLLWAIPISIISARIYYVIFEWHRYADQPIRALYIWEGGIAIHGALIGAFATGYVFAKRRGLSFWKLADIVAPSILIGQILGRWGNFMNQEAHGGPVSETFLQQTIIPDWIMNQMTIDGVTYHPTFLYESMWNVVGLIILLLIRRRFLLRGEAFLFYLTWYSIGRFFIEGMRTDSLIVGLLKTAQMVSVLTIVVAVGLFIYRRFVMKVTERYDD
ncbi:prolipoprotein diacylglyceryl transferase [Planococcaceae bacterium Storch 2/2-2]|nr:prolipoprotein diacylglyceryl transferase [Planococcaceae bacterium Storch 2/2-2]